MAYTGETIAGALTAAGRRVFRHSEKRGGPRGVFCGIGICFDCLVTVDGQPSQRACLARVAAGVLLS